MTDETLEKIKEAKRKRDLVNSMIHHLELNEKIVFRFDTDFDVIPPADTEIREAILEALRPLSDAYTLDMDAL